MGETEIRRISNEKLPMNGITKKYLRSSQWKVEEGGIQTPW